MVWQWLPYSPGGPPLHSPGEFSVPVDQGSSPLNRAYNRDSNNKPLERIGFINHGSTLVVLRGVKVILWELRCAE